MVTETALLLCNGATLFKLSAWIVETVVCAGSATREAVLSATLVRTNATLGRSGRNELLELAGGRIIFLVAGQGWKSYKADGK